MVQVVLARAEPTNLFFGRSGHRVGVLSLLKTAPSAALYTWLDYASETGSEQSALEIQHKPAKQKTIEAEYG